MKWNTNVGDRFGRLVITKQYRTRRKNGTRKICECLCDCGGKSTTQEFALINGNTKSCGCYKREQEKIQHKTHGLTYHPLYHTWERIKNRCYNSNLPYYKYYGGIGIVVYDKWINNPVAFIDYCLSLDNWNKPNYSIDRIDPYGNYEPDNIRFTDNHTQSANKRKRKSSLYTGVKYDGVKYISTIMVNYDKKYLGYFPTAKDAVIARNNFIIENNLTEYPIQKIIT